jgi:hypothetical protein
MRQLTVNGSLVTAALITGLLAAVGAGCGGSDEEKSAPPQTTKRTPSHAKRPVPSILTQVESGAEDTVDFARSGKRSKVIATAQRLHQLAEGRAAATLRRAGVLENRIGALQDRARRVVQLAQTGDALRISIAANQVSGLMPEFYARYSDRVPPDVLKLDYLDREVQLRSEAGEASAVRAAVDELSATWAKLRQKLLDAGGAKVARDYGRHVSAVNRLATSSQGHALQKEASNGLALVDLIENAFRRS